MKDKSTFRLLSIGLLSGVILSGLVFLIITFLHSQSLKPGRVEIVAVTVTQTIQTTPVQSDKKLDLNLATVSQLEALPGIGETKAKAIVDFRDKYGRFEDLSELTYVTGIGNTLLKTIQDLVIIN